MVRSKYHILLPPLFPAVLCLSKGNLTGLNLTDLTLLNQKHFANSENHGMMELFELERTLKGHLVHQKV